MTNFATKITILLLCAFLGLSLSACGKRAAHVSPPDDVKQDTFPSVYPDPATDPKPNLQ